MNYLKQVQDGIDFIESMLESEVTAQHVALEVGLSQWHFQRIFKALTNETLKAYIRARRLANSMDLLLSTDLRILDIAMSAGYENQESYTRAFRQSFGMTPGEYRKIKDRALFLKKVEIDSEYIKHIQSGLTLEPTIISIPERRLVGMRTLYFGSDSDKNNMAEKLPPLWEKFLSRIAEIQGVKSAEGYGVISQTGLHAEQLDYVCGVEVDEQAAIPEGMIELFIPASTYASFTHRGEVAQLDNTVNYVYSNWLLNSGYQHTYGADLEIYGADYKPEGNDSAIDYAIPIAT